jgi:UDP:flavonoid glycosyltransferase YjiC (YdhE family)
MAFWDGGGNVPPQRALARELCRAGHDVHVLAHDTLATAAGADGATFHGLQTAPQWDSAAPCGADDERVFIAGHIAGSAEFAADFLALHDELSPDVCVIDAMLITTLDAAIRRSLRCVAVNHLAWSPEGRAQRFLSSIATALPARDGSSTFIGLLEQATLTLASTYPQFGGAPAAPHIQFVGPIRELVAHEPWPRNICDALAPLPLEVLVTIGRSLPPERLTVSGCVEARAFVQHDRVLPDVDLVVTHAGLGTLMYSAAVGAPCLCLPNGRDQDDNAARVAALGLGRVLPPDAAPAEIGETVMAMLGDEALRASCRLYASRVERFGDLARAAALIEDCARSAEPGWRERGRPASADVT